MIIEFCKNHLKDEELNFHVSFNRIFVSGPPYTLNNRGVKINGGASDNFQKKGIGGYTNGVKTCGTIEGETLIICKHEKQFIF